jgi:hypothetical protein
MKNIFLLFLLFSFSYINAQKYVFNTLAKYSSNLGHDKRESISYSNSNSDTYFLRILKNENSFMANLFDYKNLKVHRFTVTESKIKNEIFFKFNYVNTSELFYFNKNDYTKYVFTFQTVESNDSIAKVKLNVYRNSKKKKPLRDYDLVIKKNSSNLFPVFRINSIHPYEFVEKLNIFENGVVISANEKTVLGDQIEFKLEELKQVSFELDIPKLEK